MELRDYLMSGDYILTVFNNLDISPGDFNGLAITNKRIILFSTKSGIGKLFRRSRLKSIKSLKSTFFKDIFMIQMEIYEKSWGRREMISLTRYVKLLRKDGSYQYTPDDIICTITPKLDGPGLSEIKEVLESIFKTLASEIEYSYSEKDKAQVIRFILKPPE